MPVFFSCFLWQRTLPSEDNPHSFLECSSLVFGARLVRLLWPRGVVWCNWSNGDWLESFPQNKPSSQICMNLKLQQLQDSSLSLWSFCQYFVVFWVFFAYFNIHFPWPCSKPRDTVSPFFQPLSDFGGMFLRCVLLGSKSSVQTPRNEGGMKQECFLKMLCISLLHCWVISQLLQ